MLKGAVDSSDPSNSMEVFAAAGSGVVISSQCTEDGTLVVIEQSVIDYYQNRLLNTKNDLNAISEKDQKHKFKLFATIFLMVFTKIGFSQAERILADTRPTHLLTLILFLSVIELQPRESFEIVKQQKIWVLYTWGEHDLISVGDHFRSFKNHIASSIASQAVAEKYSTCVVKVSALLKSRGELSKTAFRCLCNFSEVWLPPSQELAQ